ncbi:PilW family protein [Caldimonas brevitalea]
MVALTISLFIVGFLLTMYVNAARSKTELDKTSRQIENGRYAMDLLREDIEMAGYFGPLPQGAGYEYAYDTPAPDPCATAKADLGFKDDPWTLPPGVQGIAPNTDLACLPNRKAGTAAVVVRRLDPTPVEDLDAAVTANNFHLQTSFCYEDPKRFVFSDQPADFTLRRAFDGTACTGRNFAQRYLQRIYYVAACGRCDPSDNLPTLKRAELVDGAWQLRSLADGIDDLQFEYGFDDPAGTGPGVPPPGTPDVFSSALGAAAPSDAWANAVAVRVFLMSRTVVATRGYKDPADITYDMGPRGQIPAFEDGYKRRVYASQVRIQNISGMRETP